MPTQLRAVLLLAIWMAVPAGFAAAQGTKADYERADGLQARFRDKVFRTRVEPVWFADNAQLWYRTNLSSGGTEYVRVDVGAGTRKVAFDHARLAAELSKAVGRQYDGAKLDLDALEFSPDGRTCRFRAAGQRWTCDLESYVVGKADAEANQPPNGEKPARADKAPPAKAPEVNNADSNKPTSDKAGGDKSAGDKSGADKAGDKNVGQPQLPRRRGAVSPDGKWGVVVRDFNLILVEQETQAETRLTTDGRAGDGYEQRVHWSPDSQKLLALQTKAGETHRVTVVESAPRDQVQPKVHSWDYLKPGDRLPLVQPRLFHVSTKQAVPIKNDLFSNPWSLDGFRWQPDSSRFTCLYNQRGHQVLRLLSVDATTGEARTIIDEQSPTFIDYAFKTHLHYLDATRELIWMSERDGWNHLYLLDAETGAVKNQITKGPWLVRGVERIDDEKRQIWFRAGGLYPEQDPYYVHYARINFDGTGLVKLTAGDGTHQVRFSPDRQYLVDTYSRVDLPPVVELRRASDGELVCELERANADQLRAAGWQTPERFVAKGRDGTTDIYGVIHRPTTFSPEKRYPVIEAIYAGPHGSHVPKRFESFFSPQALAELGFVVVQIDGMGTSWRSKAFHDVCWRNLADAGFPDRKLWMKAAAEKYPYLDLSHVGIYGGSAGGQNALGALLFHGDFYHAAIADCGCHDNRMDKIWWNEAWMGWPIGPHYAEQSNVTNAHRLQGKLLLMVGEVDKNVDPASTMQVVNALIKANKDFELLVFPGGGHGSGGPYADRRRRDFFVRNLLGVEPRRAG